MVRLDVKIDDVLNREGPDLFRAAVRDDIDEMKLALNNGQTLDQFDEQCTTTPLHIACARRSKRFLQAALGHHFNPWVRDQNERLVIDHAVATGQSDFQRALFERMYPDGRVSDNLIPISEP